MTTHPHGAETLRPAFTTPTPSDATMFTTRIKHPDLTAVSVHEIRTVVLSGGVEALPERLAAAHDARDLEGVFQVATVTSVATRIEIR
jgi:hypothetical protein